jgi:hypothetical protein
MKRIILALLVGSMVSGCAASLPMKVSVDRDYNTRGVRTASVNMDCENVKTDDIDPASVPDFCQMLHASAKASIRKKAGFAIVEGPADLDINIKLEEMYGGNAAARFFVGLGAGRSVITSYITIMRDGKDIAEGRLVETSTMPNIAGNAWSNDQMIMQDIGIIGGKIADFVANPRDFDSRPDQVQPLYR